MLTLRPVWVAVVTRVGAEQQVAKRWSESDTPIEYYLPMMARTDRRRTRNPIQEMPMFPGYIFARINKKQIYQTRTTYGVMYIVSVQHSIVEVPDKDIEAVRQFEHTQRRFYVHETAQLSRGNSVVVTAGEFAGLQGTLLKGCKDGNFCVNLKVMNLSIVVHLKRDELRPSQKDGDA